MMKKLLANAVIISGSLFAAGQASAAGVYITEWMYDGAGGEYVEFTNRSGAAIDFTNWSFDDDSRLPGVFSLSGFGVVADGESVIITEADANQFRLDWGLSASVKVLGGYTNNLGRNDEINLFNSSGLEDRLTFGDQTFPGTIRTTGRSGNPISLSALGANDPAQWTLSSVSDAFGSYTSANGTIGNPGSYAPVPLPAAFWLLGSAAAGLFGVRRRKLTVQA